MRGTVKLRRRRRGFAVSAFGIIRGDSDNKLFVVLRANVLEPCSTDFKLKFKNRLFRKIVVVYVA